jgi:N-acetylmuramoyl-L-alanine amidase
MNITQILGVATLAVLLFVGTWFSIASETTEETSTVVTSMSLTASEAGFDSEPPVTDYQTVRVGAGGRYTLMDLQFGSTTDDEWRVGLQIGHYQNDEVPPELSGLVGNTGAVWGGQTEADVIAPIVDLAIGYLESEGVVVDRLPAVVPPGYRADAFVSVHADGNTNSAINGFKIAGPRRDYSGRSSALVAALTSAYASSSRLRADGNVTRRMTAYYAFNWPRYEHAIHPLTPAAIVETGFLTSPIDRTVIVNNPERAARGIADGILSFLEASATTTIPASVPFVVPPKTLSGELVCAPLRAERLATAERYGCLPALWHEGNAYIIDGIATSTTPIGSVVTVSGAYYPVQTLDTYFWFPYEVVGIVRL